MDDLNRIFVLGNLTKDPELCYTQEEKPYAELTIAINQYWKDSSGQDRDSVEFIRVTCWNRLAENCASSLHKGERIMAAGHIRFRSKKEEENQKGGIFLIADAVAASLEFNRLVVASNQ